MKITEHNAQTDEIIEIEPTQEMIEKYESINAEFAEVGKKIAEKAAQKAALLERLGITEEEAKLLLS